MLVFLNLLLSSLVLDFNCLELSSKAKLHCFYSVRAAKPRDLVGFVEGLGEAIIRGISTREIHIVSA